MKSPAQFIEVESLLRGRVLVQLRIGLLGNYGQSIGASSVLCENTVPQGCACLSSSFEAFNSLGTETGRHYFKLSE